MILKVREGVRTQYYVKCLEIMFIMIWRDTNKIELIRLMCLYTLSTGHRKETWNCKQMFLAQVETH